MQDGPGITTYAEPGSSWQPWYLPYRYGALFLHPPEPVRGRVNALRARHDPRSHGISEAHVSLTVPFPRPVTGEADRAIAEVASRHPAFEVAWGPPRRFPDSPVVMLPILPVPPIARLVEALESCAVFEGAQARRYPFLPHMTISEFNEMPRALEIMEELGDMDLSGTWLCEEIGYAVPDEDFRFTVRKRWSLAART